MTLEQLLDRRANMKLFRHYAQTNNTLQPHNSPMPIDLQNKVQYAYRMCMRLHSFQHQRCKMNMDKMLSLCRTIHRPAHSRQILHSGRRCSWQRRTEWDLQIHLPYNHIRLGYSHHCKNLVKQSSPQYFVFPTATQVRIEALE